MNEILHRHRFSITFLTLVLGAIFILPAGSGPIERFSGFTMGTSYEVQVVDIPNSTDLNSQNFSYHLFDFVFSRGLKSQNFPNHDGLIRFCIIAILEA